MRDRDRDTCEKPESDESLLTVRESIILVGICQAIEYTLGIDKIDAVVPEIGFTLRVVSGKPHLQSVDTHFAAVNREPLPMG
jgi:hypothetical protein